MPHGLWPRGDGNSDMFTNTKVGPFTAMSIPAIVTLIMAGALLR
jgi:hypothetical protein